MKRTAFDRWSCATQQAVDKIGDKWTLFIIREFIFGNEKLGFNDLMRALKPISSRTLSLKLQKLQKLKMLNRLVLQQKPLKVEYSLTQKGKDLEKSLLALADWNNKYI